MTDDKRTVGWVNWNKPFKEKDLTDTLKITYGLFKEGNTIEEIIKIRKFKQDSIERQIIELITMGLIDVKKVLPKKKVEIILKNINKQNIDKLSIIKEILGENYSWFEIKCVIASINFNSKK